MKIFMGIDLQDIMLTFITNILYSRSLLDNEKKCVWCGEYTFKEI